MTTDEKFEELWVKSESHTFRDKLTLDRADLKKIVRLWFILGVSEGELGSIKQLKESFNDTNNASLPQG